MSDNIAILIGTGADRVIAATLTLSSGAIKLGSVVQTGKGTTWLHLMPDGNTVVAVNEHEDTLQTLTRASTTDGHEWRASKAVSALGSTPCHLAHTTFSDPSRPTLLAVANYGWQPQNGMAPNFVVFGAAAAQPLNFSAPAFVGDLSGDAVGPQTNRQESSHPHMALFDRDRDACFLIVPDLGTDCVVIARIGAAAGDQIAVANKVKLPPNTGPRHAAWWQQAGQPQQRRVLFVLGELACTVGAFVFSHGGADGAPTLEPLGAPLSTLPEGATPWASKYGGELKKSDDRVGADPDDNTCAALVVRPDGRFLYATNRGRNSVVAFSIDPASGALVQRVGEFSTNGRIPRFAGFFGDRLVVANQESNSIVVFKSCATTGVLSLLTLTTGDPLVSPQCIIAV